MSTYNYSYNVLINRLEAFAAGHYLIKRFTHGQIDLADMDQDEQYPFMHVVPNNIRPVDGGLQFDFQIMFADIPRDKEYKAEYQREVISDCVRLAQDLIAEVKNGIVLFGFDVQLVAPPTIEPFQEEYKNTLTGVTFSLQLEVPWDWSACDIPATWAVGGVSTGGNGTGLTGLVLKTNGVDNAVQTLLDLTAGSNVSIVDNGDGSVTISATGGAGAVNWGAIGGTLANQIDLIAALNLKADIAALGAAAFSNDYNDLDNLPTIPTATSDLTNDSGFITIGDVPTQVNADWNASSGVAQILNKPTIPAAQVNSDWNASSGVAQILNKPTLATVATSGSYNDLTNKPTIPAAQIQSDWTQANTSALDYIKNKPTLPTTVGDMLKSVYDTDNDGIVDFAEALKTEVRNSTGATLYRGYIVYLSGSTGNLPNAVKAQANSDATSAQTFGVVVDDIANNSNGYVVTLGQIANLDTRTTATNPFTADTLVDGDVVYLSPTTPGWITNVKPLAPQHIVYVGMVVRTSPTNGTIQYRIQNGYELDELHNVVATSPANNDYLYYDSSTSLWRTRALNTGVVTNSSTVGGTTTTDALNNLNSGKVNANTAITGATNTKITYDAKGLVTAGTSLVASDLPSHTHTAAQISDSTTVGQALVKLTNPSAISYLRINADNSVTALTTAQLKAAVGDTVPYGIVVLSTVPLSATRYAAIAGGFTTTLDANVANRQFTIPIGGTVRNLYVTTSNIQSATGSLVCAVVKNGVASGVSVTFTSADGAGATKSDTSNTLSVAAGDKLAISFVNNATAASATVVSAAFIIERI